MNYQRLAMENYRMRCVEQWPDSAYKQAMLAAIRSTIRTIRGVVEPERALRMAA